MENLIRICEEMGWSSFKSTPDLNVVAAAVAYSVNVMYDIGWTRESWYEACCYNINDHDIEEKIFNILKKDDDGIFENYFKINIEDTVHYNDDDINSYNDNKINCITLLATHVAVKLGYPIYKAIDADFTDKVLRNLGLK